MILPKSFSILRQPNYILQLKRDQQKRIGELERIQNKKLTKIIKHAYYHVPYYHSQFRKAGIRPSDIKTIADLKKLPVVSKEDFILNWDGFVSNTAHIERCFIVSTSGTTGTPLRILKDQATADIESALVYYAFFECGTSLRDSFLELSCAFPSINKGTFKHGPANLMTGYYLSIFNDPAENADEIVKINPDAIHSFSSALECLIRDFHGKVKNLKLKLVFTQGEQLSEERRKILEDGFGILVNDTYGSREFSRIAFECNEHQGLHVITNSTILELLKDGQTVGPGEEGETVVTSLYSYGMPFIRYALGDIATWAKDKCVCGRNWPLIKTISGRVHETVTLPSGRRVSSVGLEVLIRKINGVKQFQIVQRTRNDIIVRVVVHKNFEEKEKRHIEKQIISKIQTALLKEELDIRVEYVPRILPQPSGKTPYFVSEIPF